MASKKQTKETSSESHSEQTDQSSGKNGSSQQLLINFLFFVVAILIGILVQQQLQSRQQERQPTAQNADLAKLVSELSTKLKSELLQELNSATTGKDAQKPPTASQLSPASEQEDLIVNEKPKKIDPTPSATVATTTKPPANKVVIDHELNTKDAEPEIRFSDGQPIVLNPDTLKFKTENTAKETKTKPQEERKKQPKEPRKEQVAKEKPRREENKLEEQQLSDEIKNFKSTKITKIKPKKLWIPIPNSNGGHRRVPPIEVKDGKEHGSSVKLWLYEEFLSKEECEQLIQAHESHLNEFKKQRPIVCFDSVRTLKKHLADLNREKVADLVTPRDFIEGTMCLNQTFSRQLEKWGLKWSFSTAFYPGESKFSTVLGKRIEEATALDESHGGKFQITSYPFDVGYKDHTDCVVDSSEERDRYATFLVYLNDLGADGGGETLFPEVGVDVKPREARALTWTNMNYETGKCEAKSLHKAAKVKHPVKKKYIIQRWYYLKNFYALGKRAREPEVPKRPESTPKVSCDQYDFGSCRMYDEWGPDHLLEYMKANKKF